MLYVSVRTSRLMLLNLRRSSKRNCRIVVMVPVLVVVVVVVAFVVVVRNRNSVLWLVVVRCGLSGMEWLFSKQIHSVVPTQPPISNLHSRGPNFMFVSDSSVVVVDNEEQSPFLSYPILSYLVLSSHDYNNDYTSFQTRFISFLFILCLLLCLFLFFPS